MYHWAALLCLVCWPTLEAWSQERPDATALPSVEKVVNWERVDWELGPTGSRASLRGLSTAGENVIWACGSHGTVLRSVDRGSSWIECGPAAFPKLEFRSIHAWDAQAACIASAGVPAVILRTDDGGLSWLEVYRHASPAAFFDGLKFWDAQRGIVFGDPIDGAFCILETTDGGGHWQALEPKYIPSALEGEAAFAASNSAMTVSQGGQVWIGTGGHAADSSRVLLRETWSAAWTVTNCPLISSSTAGIFSLAHSPERKLGVAVGGDYRDAEPSPTTAAFSTDGGQTWQLSPQPPASFCSAVVLVASPNRPVGSFVATGPSGSYRSDDGQHWQQFSTMGFHVLAASSTQLYAAGSDGRFARLVW